MSGRSPDVSFLVPAVLQKHILSRPAVLSLARSGGNDKTFPVRVSYCSLFSGDGPVSQHALRHS